MGNKKHLPCPECGAETKGGENTWTTEGRGFEFHGTEAEHDVPAKICPECGSTFAV